MTEHELPTPPEGVTIDQCNGIIFVRHMQDGRLIEKLYKTVVGVEKYIAAMETKRRAMEPEVRQGPWKFVCACAGPK